MRLLKGVKVPLYSCSLVQTEAEEDAESCRIGELDRREVTLFVYLLRPRKPISGGTLYLNPAGWVGLTPPLSSVYCVILPGQLSSAIFTGGRLHGSNSGNALYQAATHTECDRCRLAAGNAPNVTNYNS